MKSPLRKIHTQLQKETIDGYDQSDIFLNRMKISDWRTIMSNINYHDSLLVAPLRIIALNNCKELGEKVNQLIIERRHKALSEAGIRQFFL